MKYLMIITTISLTATSVMAKPSGLTSHYDMVTRLVALENEDASSGRGRLKVGSIGKSVLGKDIVLVTLKNPSTENTSTKKLFIICRQHGDEPATTEAMMKLIRDMDTDNSTQTLDLLSKVSFYIVPMVNPDGADAFTRRNANGADLNRDWLYLSQPETRAVKEMVDIVKPDIILDEHELSPGNNRSDFVETAGISSGTLPQVVAESERLQNLVIGMLRVHNMKVRAAHIEDQCPARLAHRFFPIFEGIPALLFESRQAGARQNRLDYREDLHITATMTVAKCLAGYDGDLVQRIADHDAGRYSQRTPASANQGYGR